jgi:hypothetical protein
MESLRIDIINKDAIAILKGMEQVGLISLRWVEHGNNKLSKQLRGAISGTKANEMMQYIEKERSKWEERY